jgi:hypothetical protein
MDLNMYLASRLPHSRATAQITLNPVEFSGDSYRLSTLSKYYYHLFIFSGSAVQRGL